jgi:hypothetical protein
MFEAVEGDDVPHPPPGDHADSLANVASKSHVLISHAAELPEHRKRVSSRPGLRKPWSKGYNCGKGISAFQYSPDCAEGLLAAGRKFCVFHMKAFRNS